MKHCQVFKLKLSDRKYGAQALVAVLLVATICLIIVASLGLRTAKRIVQARQNREYQVAFGNVNAGVQAAIEMLERGEYENCIFPNYCYSCSDDGYQFTISPNDSDFIEIRKDRSVDVWLPEGNDAYYLDLYCEAVDNAEAGILASLIYYNQSSRQYSVDKVVLKCKLGSSLWGFDGDEGYNECGNSNYTCKKGRVVSPGNRGELKLLAIKALTDKPPGSGSSVSAKAIVYDSSNQVIASTGGYLIEVTGCGYGGVSSTVSVAVYPSGLPYSLDYVLFSGKSNP